MGRSSQPGTMGFVDLRAYASSFTMPLAWLAAGLALRALAAFHVSGDIPYNILGMYCRWDCGYYLSIAAHGYDASISAGGGANWPFFPLMPVAISAVRHSGIGFGFAGTVTALLATLVASREAGKLCTTRRQHVLFCAAVNAGPPSLYFAIPYSECLFLLFTVLLQVQLQRDRYSAAGLAGAFLSASRAVGVLAGIAIAVHYVARYISSRSPLPSLPAQVMRRPDLLLGLALAPVGLELFAIAIYLRTGDGLAFVHAQRLWYHDLRDPLDSWWRALASGGEGTVIAASALLGIAGSAVLLFQRQFGMGVFCLLCIAVPLLFGVESLYRFTLALAPLWLLASALFARRLWSTVLAVILLAASGYLTYVAWLTDAHFLV